MRDDDFLKTLFKIFGVSEKMMRNKSLTKERIEEYWKMKKKIEEEHLQAISASTSPNLTPQVYII